MKGADPMVVGAWSRVAQGYHAFWGPRFRPFLDEALAAFEPAPGPLAIVGCGPGDEVLALRERFPERRIVATDPSAEMLDVLRARGVAGVELRREGATSLEGTFGGVFSSFALQLLPDRGGALQAWGRCLAGGGQVVAAFWPRQDEADAWGHLGRAIEATTGKGRPDWEAPLLAELPSLGLRLVEARDLVHVIAYASPEEAWTQLRDACSLQVLLASMGPEAAAACGEAWLADPGLVREGERWVHRPAARLWVLRAE